MTSWQVNYTEDAKQDLTDIYRYISDVLLAPKTAEKQTNRIMDAVDSLSQMPLRHRTYEKESLRIIGLRVLPIDSYLVFYLPDESKKSVVIIRIMYSGSDATKHLRNH